MIPSYWREEEVQRGGGTGWQSLQGSSGDTNLEPFPPESVSTPDTGLAVVEMIDGFLSVGVPLL